MFHQPSHDGMVGWDPFPDAGLKRDLVDSQQVLHGLNCAFYPAVACGFAHR